MNGSRVNPNAPQDLFCDYDVVCFVSDPGRFLLDQSWIAGFGELVILQQNEWVDHAATSYIFLMLFADGVRIDLSFNSLPNLAFLTDDSLTAVLLDKDGRIPPLLPPCDRDYWTQKPSPREFAETVNEIFWCSNNVAKGIWRDELPYVKAMLEEIIRPCALRLLAWYAASQHDWKLDSGKFGKWLRRYLPPEVWQAYAATYSGPGYAETWEALFAMLALARTVGQEVAQALAYPYPLADDQRTVAYLQRVRALPPEATSFD